MQGKIFICCNIFHTLNEYFYRDFKQTYCQYGISKLAYHGQDLRMNKKVKKKYLWHREIFVFSHSLKVSQR